MFPKHHKTGFFLKAGLFDNLSSFTELEKRISELPTTVEEGDAFEVFAEAYFFTQKIEQAEEVWPFKSIPSGIKENLSLGTNQQDMGVDGVFKTVSDEFNAYQAKFRIGRPSLTWREISTFMGLTDNVNQRVLFTNSNDMPSVINDRTGFHCIRGNDLDRLNKNDFETILKWLKSGVIEIERKTPQPHQDEAIKDIINTLNDDDRATALMACGTGKTLVALWVSERMDCQNILLLLPSLTLVRQTLHEWLRETEWQHLSYLCVCSDPTVASKELDSIKINQSDLDFAVTTDSSTVKQFLSQGAKGIKILFSTYQSAHIVAEGMDNDFRFDLGIFDEAHKTAGREGKKFGFALKDDNLLIKKRLFLTATPRHYNLNKKNEEGDPDLVYSMDNPDVYGKVAHQLSFAKAARQDIICNYKVIISVVTSEQVNKEMLKRGEVLISGDVVDAQQVANQIAFKEAIGKHSIKRIFTFHKSVKSAKLFTGKSSEGIHTQLPEFNTFHVNGTIPTAMREGIMNEFKDSDRSVISNARCLTEGVDLPAVDMVAFMSPKKSKVDIVQATGRAMRKDPHNPDKVLGYILVPLYLEITTGERIEEAVAKADFGEVWNVLQALQDQDEVLADIIRQMQKNKGRGESQKSDDFGEIIETLGVNISLKTLRESITAVCIDRLGFTWDMRYGELTKYKERFGDCNVPTKWEENEQLGRWVRAQRKNFRGGLIGEDRFKRLEDIDFEWESNWKELTEKRWQKMVGALKEYKKKHGNYNIPASWVENGLTLGSWVHAQRKSYKNNNLSEDRIKRLEDIGFEWESISHRPSKLSWEEMLELLKGYKKLYGDCNVPTNWEINKKLADWVRIQRNNHRNKQLSEDRIKRLEDIDFAWKQSLPVDEDEDEEWEKLFDSLRDFKNKNGNCNVPVSWILGQWAIVQRNNYKNNNLSEDRIKRLEDIGFEWDTIESRREEMFDKKRWDEMFEALDNYRKEHGDCNVPSDWPDQQLVNWVNTQRTSYRNGELSKERIKLLEWTGFVWNLFEANWEQMFEVLQEYRENHGHCNVPKNCEENKQLAKWVDKQRVDYKNRELDNECVKRLDNICFEWELDLPMEEEEWEQLFDSLKEYKKNCGDFNISTSFMLGQWIMNQRTDYKNMTLSNARIKRLESIGFECDPSLWEQMFNELKKYKQKNGDCNVSDRFMILRQWVMAQHAKYNKGNLGGDRIKQLEDIGFEWKECLSEEQEECGKEEEWEKMFETLQEYKKNYGDCNVPHTWTENKQLYLWILKQRLDYRDKRLIDDRIKRLEDIDFVWNLTELNWERMFEALQEYKKNHGDCNVLQGWLENKQLDNWVNKQRGEYKRGELTDDQIKRLEDIGFEWNMHELKWKRMLEALHEYKKTYGDYNVPKDWPDQQLVNWVNTQCTSYSNGKLSKERIKRLEDIGFECTSHLKKRAEEKRVNQMRLKELNVKRWNERLEALKEYRKKHRDCNVPHNWQDKQLANWVYTQRYNYRHKKLLDDQIKRLEEIGFEW